MEEAGSEDFETGLSIRRREDEEVVENCSIRPLGVDEIHPEFLKALEVAGLSWLTELCNTSWTSGTVFSRSVVLNNDNLSKMVKVGKIS